MTADALKIMIVDDDDTCRNLLVEIIADMGGARVVAEASKGRVALAKLKQTPVDIVLLDIEMPLMDGVETLARIREDHSDVGVVMLSSFHIDGTDKVVKALEMGALDFVSKNGLHSNSTGIPALRRRLLTIMGLFRARRSAHLAKRPKHEADSLLTAAPEPSARAPVIFEAAIGFEAAQPVQLRPEPAVAHPGIEAIAIGVSTGGPHALSKVIPKLPVDLGPPIFLVQHMPAAMTASLADSLSKKSSIRVREALDGERVLPSTVYLAPGDRHMTVLRNNLPYPPGSRHILLRDDPPVNSCRPSADVLFRSISRAYDGAILAVIMTGMGADGMEGVRALKSGSCHCICQTEDTCIVYGMPRAVDEAGLSDESVPLDQIADRIVELVKEQNGIL